MLYINNDDLNSENYILSHKNRCKGDFDYNELVAKGQELFRANLNEALLKRDEDMVKVKKGFVVNSEDENNLYKLLKYPDVLLAHIQLLLTKEISFDDLIHKPVSHLNTRLGNKKRALIEKLREYAKEIEENEDLQELSFYDLCKYGISLDNVEEIKGLGLSLEELEDKTKNFYIDTFQYSFIKAEHVVVAINMLLHVYTPIEQKKLRKIYSNCRNIYKACSRQKEGLTISEIASSTTLEKKDVYIALELMIAKQYVFEKKGHYSVRRMSIYEYLDYIDEENLRKRIWTAKMDGLNGYQTAEKLGLSTSRVSKALKTIIGNVPTLEEDKYAYIFQKYNFSKSEFCDATGEDGKIYFFLSTKYKHGDLPFEKLTSHDLWTIDLA